MPPVTVPLRVANGVPTCLLYFRLQLAPRKHEVRLIVYSLLVGDTVPLGILTGCFPRVTQGFEKIVNLFVQGRNGLDVSH